jgi:hypothetical protein
MASSEYAIGAVAGLPHANVKRVIDEDTGKVKVSDHGIKYNARPIPVIPPPRPPMYDTKPSGMSSPKTKPAYGMTIPIMSAKVSDVPFAYRQ